ncbi:protein FAM216A [Pelobates fuscus]|uniref:protein FAM216A n=1 Tax=Pelobates fuscus TaxID=191477 RepID=UPI002FE4B074
MKRQATYSGKKNLSEKKFVTRSSAWDHKKQTCEVPGSVCETNNVNQENSGSKNVNESPTVKTVHIPKSMSNEAFLKHPDLTTGQKRYLCSIAKVYSVSQMKAMVHRPLASHIKCGSSDKAGKYELNEKEKKRCK